MIQMAVEITPRMTLVSRTLLTYSRWTDGYSESAAEYFDRAASLMSQRERSEFAIGVGQLQEAIKIGDGEVYDRLKLREELKNDYRHVLSKIEEVLRLHMK